MKTLSVNLKNCYGINGFEHSFDFSKGKNIIIYAPNGTMKTSFSKTFLRLSKNQKPEELLHGNEPICNIKTDGNDVVAEEIFVVESLNERFKSEQMTTLLVDLASMEEYNALNKEILEKKKSLVIELNKLSGVKKDDIETQILKDFRKESLFEFLKEYDFSQTIEDLSGFKYIAIFDVKVAELLSHENVSENLDEYYKKYNELIENSPLFKKGVFNLHKAENIIKSTKTENFFDAEHKIHLHGHDQLIENAEQFEEIIWAAKEKILTDDKLKAIEEKIKAGVKTVKEFESLIEAYPELLPHLTKTNYPKLKALLWSSYFHTLQGQIEELLKVYTDNIDQIKAIEEQANAQRTQWDIVVEEFANRFYLPYKIVVENKKSIVLGNPTPNIKFEFTDVVTGSTRRVEENTINTINVLSQGEKRALYLLNIIFEIKVRKLKRQKTLFILDDIVDSFDYKNKYAIIEYLKEISEEDLFNQIILTHNFDFFRTVQGRVLGNSRFHNSFMAQKEGASIALLNAGKNKTSNPFNIWKKNYKTDEIILIAMIPFIRNLAEYIENVPVFNRLTQLLHIKLDTKKITINELVSLIETVLNVPQPGILSNPNKAIYDLILEKAEGILSDGLQEEVELEKKIVLSIAIRLKAEEFMISKISDESFVNEISSDQTAQLFKRIKQDGIADQGTLKTLELVNIITPENIHLNSFMYEPLLDMSNSHLKSLYHTVKDLM